MNRQNIYYKLPVFLQNLSVSVMGWDVKRKRYAQEFNEKLRESEKRIQWSRDRLIKYRDNRLSDFIRSSCTYVPFYKKLFLDRNVKPDEIQSLDDLKVLPILNKNIVKANFPELVSNHVPSRKHIIDHTSGTTGSGLRFITTLEAQREQWAIWWRFRRYHGIDRGTLCGYFGGRSIVPPTQDTPPFWRYDHPGNRILFSAYHINEENLSEYVGEIRRKHPPWLHGYPSLISLLAAYIIETGDDIGYQIDWVTTGAENLLEQQKQVIYRAFGVHPIEHYGLAEAVANFSECRNGKLHVDEDFSAVEFIKAPNVSGYKVIGTNLSNAAFPLIRYDTGDVVQLNDSECDCNLPGRIVSTVDGREEDYVILKDGTKLGRLDHIFKDVTYIKEAQIYQKEVGEIDIRIVPYDAFSKEDRKQLIEEFQERVGNRLEIHFEVLDELDRTDTGKLRFVVSDVDNGQREKLN